MKRIAALILAGAIMLCSCGANGTEEKTVRMAREELLKYAEENLSEFDPSGASQQVLDREYGEIVHGTYHSDLLDRERNYNILLPAGYDKSKKYPVLYALHGYWGDEYSLLDQGDAGIKCRELLGNAVAEGEAEDMIVVFPDIFCHETKEDCDGMNAENNAAYDRFIEELEDELMPFIEKNYSVATGRENTAVTGFSMGGRESLYIGFELADKFGYIGAVCPAPGLNEDCVPAEDMVFKKGEEPYLLMISAGTNDTVVYNNPEIYHNRLTENGVPHIYHTVTGGEHWSSTIRPHLYNFLRFIFKNP